MPSAANRMDLNASLPACVLECGSVPPLWDTGESSCLFPHSCFTPKGKAVEHHRTPKRVHHLLTDPCPVREITASEVADSLQ